MSLEVANLVSRFSVVVDGVEDSIRAARNFVDAAEQAGKVSSSTADRVNSLADSVERSVGSFQKGADALGLTISKLQVMAGSVEEARTAVGEWSKNIDQARSDVENLVAAGEQIPQWLGDMAQGFVDTEAVIQHYVETYGMSEEAAQSYLEKVQELLDTFRRYGEQVAQQEKLAGQVERSQRRLATGVARARAEFDASGRPMRNFFRQLMNINNGSIFTAYGIASLIGRLTGLGLVATVVIRGFTSLVRKFREGAAAVDAFLIADDGVANMVRNFEDLGNVNLSQLVGQLDDLRIRLSNIGAVDPVAATEQILEIAVDFQYLNATPDDLQETVQSLFRSVESLDFSGLAAFDVGPGKIQELNYAFQQLASQGLTQAELRTRALVEFQNILNTQEPVWTERQAAEAQTLGSALKGLETAWQDATVNNEAFTDSVRNMADTIQAAQPTLDALANFFATTIGNSVEIALNAVDGFRTIWNSVVNVGAGIAGWIARLLPGDAAQAIGENLGRIADDAAVANDQIALLNQLRQGAAGIWDKGDPFGKGPAQDFATALGNITQQGSLTLDFFEKLQRATDVSSRDAAVMTRRLIEQADKFGFTTDQVDVLRQGLDQFESQVRTASDEVTEFGVNGVDALQALNNQLNDASAGAGVIDTLRRLGDASLALKDDVNLDTISGFFSAYEKTLEVALNGGAVKLAAFRKFAEEQLKPQLSAEEWRVTEEVLGAAEDAMASAQADAELYAEAAGQADAMNVTFKDSTVDLGEASLVTADSIDIMRGSAQRYADEGPYVADVITNFITQGEGGTGPGTTITTSAFDTAEAQRQAALAATASTEPALVGDVGQVYSQVTGMAQQVASVRDVVDPDDPTGAASRAANREATRARLDAEEAQSRADFIKAMEDATSQVSGVSRSLGDEQADIESRIKKNQDALRVRETTEILAGKGAKRGGGGGGGLMDIEAVRAFLREVNEAISIAARGGVRIGTAGNAVPFEEGSFINAQGGNISVDTIVIRGVWDYADPAAKREIIRQLQEALTELQGEI